MAYNHTVQGNAGGAACINRRRRFGAGALSPRRPAAAPPMSGRTAWLFGHMGRRRRDCDVGHAGQPEAGSRQSGSGV